jgi:hypothetical protein
LKPGKGELVTEPADIVELLKHETTAQECDATMTPREQLAGNQKQNK